MRRSTIAKSVSAMAAMFTAVSTAFTIPASAATVTDPQLKISAADDGYTSSGRVNATFGAEDKLVIGTLKKDTKTSFLKFVVPARANVTGARLTLTAIGAVTGKVTISRVVDNSWAENKMTSGNAPALGLPLASIVPKASDTQVAFDLGAEIAGPGTYSFALRSSSGTVTTRFHSAEAATGGPELTVTTRAVTTTPPPAAPTATKPVPTAPPATTSPTGAPTSAPTRVPTSTPTRVPTSTPATTPTKAPAACVTGVLLVPSCGVLWGAAAGGFTGLPRDEELKTWEKTSGRTSTIFHTYHKGDENFPTAAEIAMTRDPAHPRVLLLNWRVEYGSTWAAVAAGNLDARIDAFAARIKSTYSEKFFLVLNHEPEDDVIPAAGSGMTAKDFAASYRHVIERLRAKGITNAVSVIAYMGNEKWMTQSWWKDLYPGDDVVDWVGLDSYVSAEPGYYHHGMFADLLDRKAPSGPGFYDWSVKNHPSKPIMVAEWGAYHRVGRVFDKSPQFNSVLPELAKRPQIKAIVYFDTKNDAFGDRDISIDSSATSLRAFRSLAADPLFNVQLR